jgi:diaminopropionate ammonia-lyase
LAADSPRAAEIADVGESDAARWVIDGYATLFSELDQQWDAILVPTGVGSLAAAGARHAAATGTTVVAVEPDRAACLTASLAAGRPTPVPTPGTNMAGLDCAEISLAAWPSLVDGIQGTLLVSDQEADAALRELHRSGLAVGHCGAAALAALRAAVRDEQDWLRHALHIGDGSRVLLLATEGVTDPALVTSP